MNSVMHKLAGVFLVISFIPLVIGAHGTLAIQTAESALDGNNEALQNLSRLLETANASFSDNVRLQNRTKEIVSSIAESQREASTNLGDMADSVLPRSFAVSLMRYSLGEIAQAERALLLAVNMRHLVGDELAEARESQVENIMASFGRLDGAMNSYRSLLRPDDEKTAWEAFERALLALRRNHGEFMRKIGELNELAADLVRGGPVFAKASQDAYDTLFRDGKSVRDECEKEILNLISEIGGSAADGVRHALDSQGATSAQVENLTRDYGASAAAVGDLQARFAQARTAADRAAEDSAEAVRGTSRRFWYMALFSVAGVAVALAIGILLSLRIARPVRDMVAHTLRLAQGNLSDDVPERDRVRKDEIGQLARGLQNLVLSNREAIRAAGFMAEGDYTRTMPLRSEDDQLGLALETMTRNTNGALTEVVHAIHRVGNDAATVSEASRSLSHGAQTSAAALEEISQTVGHVDKQAQDNALNAKRANKLATDSRVAAQRGYAAVVELAAAMGEIRQAGAKIALVTKLIDDIAFQTNLLALNAAVEAARAGRHGKGFAVVAGEVRNLSGRSAKAAKETNDMIAAITSRMEAGVQLASRTDQELKEIVDATDQVAKTFEEIAKSSNAQSAAMAQISLGLNQIDNVIQENTANAGSTASSSLALSRQAGELRRMVSRFKLASVENAQDRGGPRAASMLEDGSAETGKILLPRPDGPRAMLNPPPAPRALDL